MSRFNSTFEGVNSEVNALKTALTQARSKATRAGKTLANLQETIDAKLQEREVRSNKTCAYLTLVQF